MSSQRLSGGGARWAKVASLVYYGGLTLLLVLIMTNTLRTILPAGLATKIGYDSEGFFMALFLAAWIQFGVRRLSGRRRWAFAVGIGALFLAMGVVMLNVPMPGSVKTLNEAAFGIALIVPYLALRRPLRISAPLLSLAIVVVVVTGIALQPDGLVVNLAETMVALVLAPLAFDVFDARILDPTSKTLGVLRFGWYVLLVAVPVVVVALGVQDRKGEGIPSQVLHYLGRSQESFVGIFLSTVFITFVIDRVGRTGRASPRSHASVRA